MIISFGNGVAVIQERDFGELDNCVNLMDGTLDGPSSGTLRDVLDQYVSKPRYWFDEHYLSHHLNAREYLMNQREEIN